MDLQKLGEKHQKDNIDLILTVNKNIYMLDSGRLQVDNASAEHYLLLHQLTANCLLRPTSGMRHQSSGDKIQYNCVSHENCGFKLVRYIRFINKKQISIFQINEPHNHDGINYMIIDSGNKKKYQYSQISQIIRECRGEYEPQEIQKMIQDYIITTLDFQDLISIKHMQQYPEISLDLKDKSQISFDKHIPKLSALKQYVKYYQRVDDNDAPK